MAASTTNAATATYGYGIVAQAVAIHSVVEIGPNLLAAITAVVGVCVMALQLRVSRRVSGVQDAADTAQATAEHAAGIVERRAENRGVEARSEQRADDDV